MIVLIITSRTVPISLILFHEGLEKNSSNSCQTHLACISSLLNMFQIPLEAPSWKQLSSTFIHLCDPLRLTAVLVRTLANTVFHKLFNSTHFTYDNKICRAEYKADVYEIHNRSFWRVKNWYVDGPLELSANYGWATHWKLNVIKHYFRLNCGWIVFVPVIHPQKTSGGDKCAVWWHFSPLYHEMCNVCWGQAKARLSAEASGRHSSAAHLRATLVQSTREHHLKHSNPASAASLCDGA